MTKRISLATLALLVLAAGCGGGGHTTPAVSNPGSTSTAAGTGSATLQLTIPLATGTGTSAHARPQFVSSGTQSVTIKQGATLLGTFNTVASASGCATTTTGLQCSFSIAPTVGANQIFTVTAYSQQNAGGSILSTGQTSATIVASTNTNIPVTMGGQIASFGFTFPTLPAGTAGSGQMVVMAKDASGATIVGPGAYTSPITVSVTANGGHVQLNLNGGTTTSSIQVSSPSDAANIVYDATNIGFASVSASTTPPGGSAISQSAYFGPTPTLVSAHVSTAYNVSIYAYPSGNDSRTGSFWYGVYDQTSGNWSLLQVTPSAVATEVGVNQVGTSPYAIVPNGPNGLVWFAQAYTTPVSYGSMDPVTHAVTLYSDASNQNCYTYGVSPAASGQAWLYGQGYCSDTNQSTLFALDTTTGNVDARLTYDNNLPVPVANGFYVALESNVLQQYSVTGSPPALTISQSGTTGFGQQTFNQPTTATDGSLWDSFGCTFAHITPGSPLSASTAAYFTIPSSICTVGQNEESLGHRNGVSVTRNVASGRGLAAISSNLSAPPFVAPDGSVWSYGPSGLIAGVPGAATSSTVSYSTAVIPIFTAGGQTLPFGPQAVGIDPVTHNLVYIQTTQGASSTQFVTIEVAY